MGGFGPRKQILLSCIAAFLYQMGVHVVPCIAMHALKTYQGRFGNIRQWKTMAFGWLAAETR
jgi:hypothetical protein